MARPAANPAALRRLPRTSLAARLRTLSYWPGADVLSRGATLKNVRLVSLARFLPPGCCGCPAARAVEKPRPSEPKHDPRNRRETTGRLRARQ